MNRFDHNLSREELIDLFWQSEAPQALAGFCSGFNCPFIKTEPVSFITEQDLMDPSVRLPTHSVAAFYLSGQPFGGTIYIAVVCGDQIIVPPFPIEQRELLPTFRPTKEAQNESARSTVPAHTST